jgi:hypothetical protein
MIAADDRLDVDGEAKTRMQETSLKVASRLRPRLDPVSGIRMPKFQHPCAERMRVEREQ